MRPQRAPDWAVVHAAGELTPAFEVLDAVGGGVAEMGHTASFYGQGKTPAAATFTAVPVGRTSAETWPKYDPISMTIVFTALRSSARVGVRSTIGSAVPLR